MKKLLVVAAMALGLAANAQGKLSAGLNLGLPMGDLGKATVVGVQPEVNYMVPVIDNLEVGGSASFVYIIGKEIVKGADRFNVHFLPIAGTARYSVTDQFKLGLDLGYAVGTMENAEGAFYYRPVVGYSVTDDMTVQLTYPTATKDGKSLSMFALGIVMGL